MCVLLRFGNVVGKNIYRYNQYYTQLEPLFKNQSKESKEINCYNE